MTKVTKALFCMILLALAIPTSGSLNPNITLFDEKELNCLAKAIYHEARGEILAGQYAVAKTVLNRVSDSRFPNTICRVIYQPKQFPNIRRTKIRDLKSWDTARTVAYDVLNMNGNYSFKALYFHAKFVSPGWKKKPIARIGNHIFYI